MVLGKSCVCHRIAHENLHDLHDITKNKLVYTCKLGILEKKTIFQLLKNTGTTVHVRGSGHIGLEDREDPGDETIERSE